MNNFNLKNVSNLSDEEFEKYKVWFHIKDRSVIWNNGEIVERRIAEELGLKLESCQYGADSYKMNFNPRMLEFIKLLENKYGKVEYFEDTLGFTLGLLFEVDDKECIYSVGAGNNGQEICVSMYMKELDLIDKNEFKRIVCAIDEEILGYIKECKLDKYY